jgi:hypothetical protein
MRRRKNGLARTHTLQIAIESPPIQRTIAFLKRIFKYEDSKWVDLALDHMNLVGDDRDREARFIVRAVMKVVESFSD